MENEGEETVDTIKNRGNECIKQGNYFESISHYSRALKIDPTNYSVYSNRSLAYFKAQQYHFALEDAKETIKLNPSWPKGYYRKAEVEFAAGRYADALISYQEALRLKTDDEDIIKAIDRTHKKWAREIKADEQVPWLGAGIGLVLGVIIVIADFLCTMKPTLNHPILMATLTIAVAMVGYGLAWGFRYYVKCQKNGLLESPVNLDSEVEADNSINENKPVKLRFNKNKNHGRYRYKIGKQ